MKKRILFVFGLFLLVLGLAACQTKPEDTALQLAEAVNAKDVDSALALFTDGAMVTSTSPEPFVGKDEIRGWLEMMVADNFQLEAEVVEVNGNTVIERDVIRMDSLAPLGLAQLEGVSEVTVQNGKISALTFVLTEESLAEYLAAMEAAAP